MEIDATSGRRSIRDLGTPLRSEYGEYASVAAPSQYSEWSGASTACIVAFGSSMQVSSPTSSRARVLSSSNLIAVAALLAAACGGVSRRGTVIEMEAMVVQGGGDEFDEELALLTGAEVFDRANDLLREGEYDEALRHYLFLEANQIDESYVRAAVYNAALCYEGLDSWEQAGSRFRDVVERWPESEDATDALYRWAEARSRVGDWAGIPPLMERVLRRARLSLVDRTEAHLRWANAAIEVRDYPAAEQHYREVIEINQQAQMSSSSSTAETEQPLPDFHPIMVQAHFGLGRTYHELFLEIKLVLPRESIQHALVDKAQLLEQARLSYLDAVRAGHTFWSVAAGFMLGQLYEDFFLDVLACEVPHEFDELTTEVYFEELRGFLSPVVERALAIYNDNLAMAERMGADSVWVEETRTGIGRVQSYIFDPSIQAEQQRLILQQRHPHSARDPARRWGDSDDPPDS